MEEHPQARIIIETLHRAGFIAYYAGGWVRDFLLQHPSDDIDIATNAPPETVQTLFSHTVPIGIAFGIILVIIDGHQYEVATFRQDLDYQDGRRPNRVAFSTAMEDAKRRDFTINGMFYDPIHQELLDYVGGRADLQARVVRAIGDPHERIKEDRLRMIRAIRMACRFQFEIEQKTQHAIRAHATELFPAVAIERIVQELAKGHAFGHLQKMLLMLYDYDLLSPIFPELTSITKEELQKRLEPTYRYPHESPLIAFILPMLNLHLDQQIALAKRLKLSKADLQFITFLFRAREIIGDDQHHVRTAENVEWAHLYANELWPSVFPIIAAHIDPKKEKAFRDEHEKRMKHLHPAIERIRKNTPLVTSQDLKNAGIAPGKQMGILLKEAERIACNENLNDSSAALKRLQQSPLWPT